MYREPGRNKIALLLSETEFRRLCLWWVGCTKKPAGVAGFAGRSGREKRAEELHRFRQFGIEFDGVRVVALDLVEAVAAFEHAVEFVDQERDGLVAFVGGDGGIEIGTVDADMPFGDEASVHGLFSVTFQLHSDSNYSFLVSKQSLHFFTHERFD